MTSKKIIEEKRIERTIKGLELNNMQGFYVKTRDELIALLDKMIGERSLVGFGGSQTLIQLNLIDYLRKRDLRLLDRYKEGLTKDNLKQMFRESFFADNYLMSTNALTEDGCLLNVDGNGNRVAALTFGPDSVIVITGSNKIVKNIDEAIERNKRIAAPANCVRLNLSNPCTKTGYCMDCKGDTRICCTYVITKQQINKDRIKVIIIDDETLGY